MQKLVFLLLIFVHSLYAQKKLFTGPITNLFRNEIRQRYENEIRKKDEEKKKLPYFKNEGKVILLFQFKI